MILTIKLTEFCRGKGFWKFINSLLTDKECVNLVICQIKETKMEYAALVYEVENINEVADAIIAFRIPDNLFLDTLLMNIRGKTISYSTHKKKMQRETQDKLENEIKLLEENYNEESLKILEEKQKSLEEIRYQKLKGYYIRSRARWIEEGEKPTKCFCNSESRNYVSKQIPKLILNDNTTITNQSDILNHTKTFYETLYMKKEIIEECNIDKLLEPYEINKLTDDESNSLEGKIKHSEVLKFLKQMKNDKSPGPDGFTAECFKFFWSDLGHFITRAINNSYEKGEFSNINKLGIITCTPKPVKR